MSLWGAVVITNLFSAIPLVGPTIVEFLWGGYSVDQPTLNRFFSLHYLLPFMIAGVVVLHVWALHVTGQNNPAGVEVKDVKKDTVPFTPYATIKDAVGLVFFLAFFVWFAFFQPNYLGHAVNYVPADPLVTPPHIVPEWYFLPFYAILRAITFDINLIIFTIPSKLGGVLAMFAAIAVLAFLPWLDTSKVKSSAYRPLHKQFFWAFVVVCVMLGWLGSKPAEYPYTVLSLIFTGLYFAYFLVVLPLLGLFETRASSRLPSPMRCWARTAVRLPSRPAPLPRRRPKVERTEGLHEMTRFSLRMAAAGLAGLALATTLSPASAAEQVEPPRFNWSWAGIFVPSTGRSCSAASRSTRRSARPAIASSWSRSATSPSPAAPASALPRRRRSRLTGCTRCARSATTASQASAPRASPTASPARSRTRRPPRPPMAARLRRTCR